MSSLQIGLELNGTAIGFPSIFYSDLVIAVYNVRLRKRLVFEKDLASLIDLGLVTVMPASFELVYQVSADDQADQYIIAASLNSSFIMDSPVHINVVR